MLDSVYFNKIRIRKINYNEIPNILPFVINSGKEMHIHLLAASSIAAASRVQYLTEIYNSGVSLCDSSPLAKVIRLRHSGFINLRGSDLFRGVVENDDGRKKHFFIVSNFSIIDSLKRYTAKLNPKFMICGSIVPPYLNSFDFVYENWISQIKSSNADCVWIGLGSPKQDIIACDLSQQTGIPCIAIGAALEFVSGQKKEAPKLLQKYSLEWLFRLFSEPRRLFKRYTIDNFIFVLSACKFLYKKDSNN
jgi:N-acetylglucosaminyldiphosphoundecaprenol N-acetyl-beta-D-mannosaminyltransferase